MLQEGLYLTMAEKTQSSDIDISIISLSDLSGEEKSYILSFSCGNESLDNFFSQRSVSLYETSLFGCLLC